MGSGLIYDIRRYSVHDGPGIRTTVFFKGCPLQCNCCHNPESWLNEPQVMVHKHRMNGHVRPGEEIVGRQMSLSEVMEVLLKDRVFYEESRGGITFSGGEPLLQPDFLIALLKQCKKEGLHTAVDTSGYAETNIFVDVALHAHLLLFDLKVADPLLHQVHTGVDNKLILQNLMALPADGPELIIRIPVIPGLNNNPEQMRALCAILEKIRASVVRVELLAFHRLGKHKYEALNMPVPEVFRRPHQTLNTSACQEIFTRAGFQVKVGA